MLEAIIMIGWLRLLIASRLPMMVDHYLILATLIVDS